MFFREPYEQYVGRWFKFLEDERVNSPKGLILDFDRRIYFPLIFLDAKYQILKHRYFRIIRDDGSPIYYSIREYDPLEDELVEIAKYLLSQY